MKEDYLWDKTGGDAGIEKLENTLRVFRAKTDTAPATPVQKAEELSSARRQFISFSKIFGFAAASLAVILTILLSAWFQVPIKNISVGDDLTKTLTPKIEIEIPVTPAVSNPAVSVNKKPDEITNTKRAPEQKSFRSRHPKSQIPNPKSNVSEIKLTAEEKYAYDQLMLALSITGSKLKLVRDKIEGSEDQKIVVKKEDDTRRN